MIYRDFRGMKLSALGFGTMRLPVIDGNDGRVDEDTVRRMIDTALEAREDGMKYFTVITFDIETFNRPING